jgi:hypothetical protein
MTTLTTFSKSSPPTTTVTNSIKNLKHAAVETIQLTSPIYVCNFFVKYVPIFLIKNNFGLQNVLHFWQEIQLRLNSVQLYVKYLQIQERLLLSHFHPSLIFESKARRAYLRGVAHKGTLLLFTIALLASIQLQRKFITVTKHSSLL